MPKVSVEKIIKAERTKVFNTITDFENLPNILPDFFKSVKVVSKENNTIVIEESTRMAGRDITQKTKHILSPHEKHEVFQRVNDRLIEPHRLHELQLPRARVRLLLADRFWVTW